jgi:hypothetical protein
MKKAILLCVTIISYFILTYALVSAQTFNGEPNYQLECISTSNDGNYMVKVWVMTSDAKKANELAKKYAVHGIIFRGLTANKGCSAEKPWVDSPSVEKEKSDFFKTFFENKGKYLEYVSGTNDLKAEPDIIKNKSGTKIGIIVTVAKEQLRKTLVHEGIIKSLNSGF